MAHRLFVVVLKLLTAVVCLAVEHRLKGTQASVLVVLGSLVVVHAWAQPFYSMLDPHGPGMEPASLTPVGILSTTGPPGKSHNIFL